MGLKGRPSIPPSCVNARSRDVMMRSSTHIVCIKVHRPIRGLLEESAVSALESMTEACLGKNDHSTLPSNYVNCHVSRPTSVPHRHLRLLPARDKSHQPHERLPILKSQVSLDSIEAMLLGSWQQWFVWQGKYSTHCRQAIARQVGGVHIDCLHAVHLDRH